MFKPILAFVLGGVALVSQQSTWAAEALTDPTRPLGYSAAQPGAPTWHLQSVLVSDARKLATINGQTLHENDVIRGSSGIRVAQIERDGVILQQGEKRWRLALNSLSVRQ